MTYNREAWIDKHKSAVIIDERAKMQLMEANKMRQTFRDIYMRLSETDRLGNVCLDAISILNARIENMINLHENTK